MKITLKSVLISLGSLIILFFVILVGLIIFAWYYFDIPKTISETLLKPDAPPDVVHPQKYDSDTLRFDYPGNWKVEESHESLMVSSASSFQGNMNISINDPPQTKVSEESLSSFKVPGFAVRETHAISEWGPFKGSGVAGIGTLDLNMAGILPLIKTNLNYIVFSVNEGNDAADGLFINEISCVKTASNVEPGFRLIRSTLKRKGKLKQSNVDQTNE